MKSRLVKKLIAYGFLPFMVVFLAVSPLGADTAHAYDIWGEFAKQAGTITAHFLVGVNMVLSSLFFFLGQLLDLAIKFSIAPNVGEDGLGGLYRSDTINVAWTLLRDIINMSFIFILLYIAIGTVLNLQNVNWKKQVSQIIIAAILVNFSLFITRIVIDGGNILAHSFYQEITVCGEGECGGKEYVGISEKFANVLGIPYFAQLREGNIDTGAYVGWAGAATALMQIIVTVVATWVFLSVAILFLARTVALIFIMILSPIGIAGSSLPLLGKYAKQWREELFKQSVLGVVFLFFAFIVLLFGYFERDNILTNEDLRLTEVEEELMPIKGPVNDTTPPELYLLMYTLVIAALIISLRLTKNLSGQIGKLADNVGKGIIGVGLGVGLGGAALAMRAGAGGVASRTLANEELKAKARAGDRVAQTRLNAANVFAKSSFDVRQSSLGKVATKKLKGIGLDVSTTQKAGKGGYEAGMEGFQKSQIERAKRYAPSKDYLEAEAKKEGATSKEEIAEKSKTISAREQEKFAASLEEDSWWKKARRLPVVAASARNMDRRRKRAAEAIRKEINKKDFDRLLDAVKESTKEGDKKEDKE